MLNRNFTTGEVIPYKNYLPIASESNIERSHTGKQRHALQPWCAP
jgi:hypothetical protein